jgi:membrane-associated phospholipid phosphatase
LLRRILKDKTTALYRRYNCIEALQTSESRDARNKNEFEKLGHSEKIDRKAPILKAHEKFQKVIEKAFFKGKSTKWSVRISYWCGNIFLMFFVFFVLLFQIGYHWVGQLHPISSGISLGFVFDGLDNAIPYIPITVIFYLFMFLPFGFFTMIYFAFFKYKMGYGLAWSLILINAIALVFYIVFPVSVYAYHQYVLAQPTDGDFFATLMKEYVESLGTPFNCFPSLHVAVTGDCFYTLFRYNKVEPSRAARIIVAISFVICAGIILSTLFLKQHYILDVVAGILLAWGVGRVTLNHFWKPFM